MLCAWYVTNCRTTRRLENRRKIIKLDEQKVHCPISFLVINFWRVVTFYAKEDFKVVQSCPILLNFFILCQRYCRGLQLLVQVMKVKENLIVPMEQNHCLKSVRIWSFFGPYFPAFGLNTERYAASLHIQSECRKIQTRKIPNTNTFHAANVIDNSNLPLKLLPEIIE